MAKQETDFTVWNNPVSTGKSLCGHQLLCYDQYLESKNVNQFIKLLYVKFEKCLLHSEKEYLRDPAAMSIL